MDDDDPLLDDSALIFANSPPPLLFLLGENVPCAGDVGGVTSDCTLVRGSETPSAGDRGWAWRTLGSWFIPEYSGLELGSLSSWSSSLFGSLYRKLYSWIPYLLYPIAVYLDSF